MNRHQHSSCNDVLGAPPGVPIDSCHALPITRVQFAGGEHGVVSWWMPSAEERELLLAGNAVRLCVMGVTHAPLLIGVDGDGVML